ncbi:hypothetical protein HDU93_007031 [Gonapodya sp. JEL0774]|nr:hypothetical protein HDU93_007031 [Gonapodya sp. JEL0774]
MPTPLRILVASLALAALAAAPANSLPVGALDDPTHPLFPELERPMLEFAGVATFAHTPYVKSCFKSLAKDVDSETLIELGRVVGSRGSQSQKVVEKDGIKLDAAKVIERLLYPKFDIAVVGIPFDTSVTYRPGARFGPRGIRAASMRLSAQFAHDPIIDDNPLRRWATIVDCGDIPTAYSDNAVAIAQMEAYLTEVAGRKTADPEASPKWTKGHPRILTLGGDHTIVLPILRVLNKIHGKTFHVIHFDSHIDTWEPAALGGSDTGGDAKTSPTNPYPSVPGSPMLGLNHGTPLWHAVNEGLIPADGLNLHVGLRGKLVDMGDYATDDAVGFKRIHAADIDQLGVKGVIDRIVEVVSGGKATAEPPLVYISLDIDVLDPAFAPGTGTPEVGGWTTRELRAILRGLKGRLRVIGADVVEVSPPYDHFDESTPQSEQTTLAAAEVSMDPRQDLLSRDPLCFRVVRDWPSASFNPRFAESLVLPFPLLFHFDDFGTAYYAQTNYLDAEDGGQHEVPSHDAGLHLTYGGQARAPPPNLTPEEAFAVVYGGTTTSRAVGDAKQYKSSTLINIVSAGVGWWAMKEYEKRRQQQGLPASNSQWAHKLIAAMAAFEVSRICQQLYADRSRDINDDIGSLPSQEELQKQLTDAAVRVATTSNY